MLPAGITVGVTYQYRDEYWEDEIVITRRVEGVAARKRRRILNPTAEECCGWNVHVPGNTAGEMKVRGLFGEQWNSSLFKKMTSLHSSTKAAHKSFSHKIPNTGPAKTSAKSKETLSEETTKILLEKKIIQRVSAAKANAPHFDIRPTLLPEWKKKRWRILAETRELNAQLKGKCPAKLPRIVHQYQTMMEHSWCVEVDFQCFYFQLALGHGGSPYLFKEGAEWYRWLVVPMGTTWAVAVAQEVAEKFCDTVFEDSRVENGHTVTYIDNIYIFTHDYEVAKTAEQSAIKLAEKYDAKITTQVTQRPQVLGLECDLREKKIVLHEAYYTKHEAAWTIPMSNHPDIGTLSQWLGVWIRAAYMLRVPLYKLRQTLRLLSKVSRRSAQENYETAGKSIQLCGEDLEAVEEIRHLTKRGTHARWRKENEESKAERLAYCDAAEWGTGYIAIDDSSIVVSSEPWKEECPTDQVTREALGACRAIEELHSSGNPLRTILLVDAAALVYAEKKGWSKNEHINKCVELCNTFKVLLLHVPGVENLADGVSRGKRPPAEEEVNLSLKDVTNQIKASETINHAARTTW